MISPDPSAKSISDLDNLLQLLCKGVKRSTPLERSLHELLVQADQQMLILRLSVSVDSSPSEIADTIRSVRESLRAAELLLAKGRCDETTRAAIKLASGIVQGLQKRLSVSGA